MIINRQKDLAIMPELVKNRDNRRRRIGTPRVGPSAQIGGIRAGYFSLGGGVFIFAAAGSGGLRRL